MTKVKICGLLEEEHVQVAVEAGADAIGFVFAPSSRRVSVEQAQRLAKHVPNGVWKIGVFVDETAEEIQRIFKEVPLDYVQYHGQEAAADIQKIGLPSIKALPVREVADVEEAVQYHVDYYLFDAPGTVYQGGSGITFDWSLLQNAGVAQDKIILAGGLHKDNVQEAVRRVQPFMVDVSSGVEEDKRKSPELIHKFIRAAKEERV